MSGDHLTELNRSFDTPLSSLRLVVVSGPDEGRTIEGTTERMTIGSAEGNDLVVNDETVSRYHLELHAEGDRIFVEDHGSTNGTIAGSVQIQRGLITRGTTLRLGKTTVRVEDGAPIQPQLYAGDELHGLRGSTAEMRRLMAQISQVAKSDASVLLLGETGTGKEVVARAIHNASPRAEKPLEIVDCGALMPTLIASELFGHEKGAFTGAAQLHHGAFERAEGGTIFLDEIGELPEQLQVRLLGVLERRAFRRVGGTKTISVNVRVISATHRDLRKWVNRGEFRADLYYRIAVARLLLPPLRERRDDIPLLVEHFMRQLGVEEQGEEIMPAGVLESLKLYHWPGNVRELRNFVETALAFGEAPDIQDVLRESDEEVTGEKGSGFLSLAPSKLFQKSYIEARDVVLHDFQQAYLKDLMERASNNVSRAATLAKMNRPHLIQLLKRHGIK